MGQQGDHLETGVERSAEEILQTVTQDLKSLQQGLVSQLSQEVTQLQGEKTRLKTEVEQLQAEYQTLQPIRSLPQQQQWARQLAQGLAIQLQTLMVQRLQQSVGISGSSATDANGQRIAQRLLASLDSSFGTTFRLLQQDLSDSQSALSQRLGRSQTQEQQAEVILESLVNCLREQLHAESTQPALDTPDAAPIPFEVGAGPLPIAKQPKRELSQIQLGFLLVLLSTAALSFHNVVVRILSSPSTVLGLVQTGGFIQLGLGLGNSLLILWLRMLVVLPLMIPVSMWLYPPVWRDLRQFLTLRDRRPVYTVVGSGVFLFLSQILIYIAIGQIGPSVAVAILFMYPLVTVPLAWLLFRDRPTPLRWVVMGVISLGVILAALPSIEKTGIASGSGVAIATAAGFAFACYLIFMQLGFKAKLHPIPVSLVQFFTIFVLSSTILILPLNLGVRVAQPIGFVVGGIILGVLTLVGYLSNNFGVRFMGAAQASIVASSGPVVTALLAFLIIQTPLNFWQIVGILLVTGGVTALSFERMKAK